MSNEDSCSSNSSDTQPFENSSSGELEVTGEEFRPLLADVPADLGNTFVENGEVKTLFTPGPSIPVDTESSIAEELLKHFHDPPLNLNPTQAGGEKNAVNNKFLHIVDDMAKRLSPDAPPREPKDWWDQFDEDDRPVRRDHFKEFKSIKEDNEHMLRTTLITAGKKQQQSSMEAQLWKKKFEDQVKRGDVVNTEQVNAMIKGLREKGKLSEPIYSSDSEAEEDMGKAHFLWDNLNDNIQQTHVEILVARVRVMWMLRDWSAMVTRSEEAIAMAGELDYPPLVAKCKFYLGVAEYGSRNFPNANDCFEKAGACIGKYWEGSQVEEWRVKAKKAMKESPPLTEHSSSSGMPFSPSPDSLSKCGRWSGQRGPHGGEWLGGFPGDGDSSESGEEQAGDEGFEDVPV